MQDYKSILTYNIENMVTSGEKNYVLSWTPSIFKGQSTDKVGNPFSTEIHFTNERTLNIIHQEYNYNSNNSQPNQSIHSNILFLSSPNTLRDYEFFEIQGGGKGYVYLSVNHLKIEVKLRTKKLLLHLFKDTQTDTHDEWILNRIFKKNGFLNWSQNVTETIPMRRIQI